MWGKKWWNAAKGYSELLRQDEEPYVGCFLESRIGLGLALQYQQKHPQAVKHFGVASELSPGLGPSLLLAKSWYLLGEETHAESIFESIGALSDDADSDQGDAARLAAFSPQAALTDQLFRHRKHGVIVDGTPDSVLISNRDGAIPLTNP